jgi:dienelactone hydrolase
VVLTLIAAGCGADGPAASRHTAAGPAPACVTAGAPFAVRHGHMKLRRGTRRLDPDTWSPPRDGCRRPLVVFSHGHHGAPASCAAFCDALARAGFLVVAPRHHDGATFYEEAAARRADLEHVLDHLALPYDKTRIGLTGHSFGGYSAAEVGAEDRRVKAVVSMAGTPGYAYMSGMRAATLIVAGTRDPIETVKSSRAADEAIPPGTPHRLLVIDGARHGDLLRSARVRRTATDFLRDHLAGCPC